MASITVIGALENFQKEYRGASMFPTAELDVVSGNSTIRFKAVSSMAHLLDDILGSAPRGVIVKIEGTTSHRNYNERTFMDLNATSAMILGSMGDHGSVFEAQGFVAGVREFTTKSGNVLKFAQLREMSYDRDEHVEGMIEMFVKDDDALDQWADNTGKVAIVNGRLSGRTSDKGYVNHSFNADNIIYSPVPSFWSGFSESEADVLADPADPTSAAGLF